MEQKQFSVKFSKKIYGSNEILKAHHHISDLVMMNIRDTETDFQCDFKIISTQYSQEEITEKFYYLLSREQIKRILADENKKIRDLIVQQAFKPIENLSQVIDEL